MSGSSHPGQRPQRAGWYSFPAEIRLMIYPLSWEAQTVTVRCRLRKLPLPGSRPLYEQELVHPITRPSIPATMHLNYEARQVSL
jgi:hypothetical protein